MTNLKSNSGRHHLTTTWFNAYHDIALAYTYRLCGRNPEKAEAYLFHLYSESGQLLFAETRVLDKGEQILRFDFSHRNLPEGMYFLRISDSLGELKTKRVVKVRP